MPYFFVKFDNFQPRFTEIKLKDSLNETDSTGVKYLNEKIQGWETTLNNPALKAIFDTFHGGFPLVPFPTIERCLGLTVKDSSMKISEGVAIMGLDFEAEQSDAGCLFNMTENIKDKERRAAELAMRGASGSALQTLGKLSKMFQKQSAKMSANTTAPTLSINQMMSDLN